MKKGTIKSKIFKFNILTTIATLLLVAIVFNISINYYFQKIAMDQLNDITTQTNKIIIKEVENLTSLTKSKKALVKSFYRMEKSLSKKLSVINAEGFFISSQGNLISLREDDEEQTEIENAIMDELLHSSDHTAEQTATVGYKGIKYATVLMPVPQNKINIQAYVLYASLQKINELKKIIIGMLIIILLIALVISISISSYISKRVSNPLTTISGHLRVLSERNFKTNIEISVDNEIQELVDNINRLAEKLEVFDQSQKKFLEDVSHEFRTPLMIIQSHAEGLKYGVVENKELANDIIIDETRRLTLLIDDLLYLSRLDTDEEIYQFHVIEFSEIVRDVSKRMKILAEKDSINLSLELPETEILLTGDEEKLSRALTNLVSNCMRYAENLITVKVSMPQELPILQVTISDDGRGFEDKDLLHLFERFYKGENGNFGLGLTIVKTIIERHNGTIEAKNGPTGGAQFIITLPHIVRE